MMSRKNYNEAIELMSKFDLEWEQRDIEQITRFLVDFFKQDNPRFDTERFIDAVNKRYRLEYPITI